MERATIAAKRALLLRQERRSSSAATLYAHEAEFERQPHGISVLVAVRDGAAELPALLVSLLSQSLARRQFEVLFALNGCQDDSAAVIQAALGGSDLNFRLFEETTPGISRARNRLLPEARFRYSTFVDHDDFLSRAYLEEVLSLGDCRSVVVSNIQRVEQGRLGPEYAQRVISDGFRFSAVHGAADIDLCYRAYSLNAIKTAPTSLLRQVRYDEGLAHCEDLAYWRDVVHRFLPITVKSPGWRDIYYRRVRPNSASRSHASREAWAAPRLEILRRIESARPLLRPGGPQHRFDWQLERLLRQTLAEPHGQAPTKKADPARTRSEGDPTDDQAEPTPT